MTWKGRARSISSRGCPSDEFITWRSPTGRDQELLAGQGSQGACALAAAFPVRVSLFRIGVIPGRDTASQSRESAHGNSQLKFRVHRVSVLEPDGSTTERERERERARSASICTESEDTKGSRNRAAARPAVSSLKRLSPSAEYNEPNPRAGIGKIARPRGCERPRDLVQRGCLRTTISRREARSSACRSAPC